MKTEAAGVFIHPRALVETDQIGPGTRVWAFAHVMKNARVGAECNICDHCFIESNVTVGDRVTVKNGVAIWDKVEIGDDVFIGPNAVFTNDPNPRVETKKGRDEWVPTYVRRGASIGANATIVCGVTIGEYAFIAAGAVVTRDVLDYALMVGVPARVQGWMCRCGTRIRLSGPVGKCSHCGCAYEQTAAGALRPAASAALP